MADQLAQYRRKRDFGKTPEPSGTRRPRRAKGLLFVIQKHAATRLHYDFRLEMEGVLKSWAVPKGPSLDPQVKRLAVHVEDHPLDYADFEGVIPEGQYGGGTVMVWDTGSWKPLGDEDPVEAYRKGTLKFELDGKKLHGAWALVRLGGKKRPNEKNWLLIKERDEYAKPGSDDEIVEEQQRSAVSGRDMRKIAAARDRVWQSNRVEKKKPKGFVKPPTVDLSGTKGAKKRPMPAKIAPQLATLAEHVPTGEGWLHEIKLDGYRIMARAKGGKITLLSRNGLDWTEKFPSVVEALARLGLEEAILDGEVVHLDENGVSSFSALQDDLSAGDTSQVVYYLFDLLHLDGYDIIGARLADRKRALAELLAGENNTLRLSEHVEGRGSDVYKQASKLKLEGVISKRADAPYRSGRSNAWIKVKCQAHDELIIIGWTDPAGARQGFGSLLLGYYDAAGRLHFAGAVGTGFGDETLRDLRRRLDKLARKAPPSRDIASATPRRAHWVTPELVAEVRYSEWTTDGRLRHPAFLGLRQDKTAKDVVLDPKLGTALVSAKPEKAPVAAPGGPLEVAGMRISNPDKVLYPESGVTKLELARYYETIADRILPELAGRPLTLVRCPDGWKGECFYQKHATQKVMPELKRIEITEKSGAGVYLIADDLPGLLSLVQMGVLEIHVWGSTRKHIELPDRLVFDFDPDEGLPWERVGAAALQLRGLLAEMGLDSFPKVTGGKGLHVVVPVQPRYDWDEIKAFTKAVAETMAAQQPAAFTATLSKKARRGRIFVDYLRNQRGATAIAPYSARARAKATVAAPVSWKEVEDGIRSDAFTIRTLPERLAKLKRDPWRDLARTKQSLPAAIMRKLSAA